MTVEVKRNQFYIYDQAIFRWLRQVQFRGVPVPVVWSSPWRAWGKMQELYLDNGLSRGQQKREVNPRELEKARVFLPFCSVQRTSVDQDNTRYQRHRMRRMRWSRKLTTDPGRRFVLQAEFPQAVNIKYNVEFWCSTVDQSNVFRTALARAFRANELFLGPLPHYHGGGDEVFVSNQIVPLILDEFVDNSDLEPGAGRRVQRFSLGLTLRGWIMQDVEECRTVLAVTVETLLIDYTKLLSFLDTDDPQFLQDAELVGEDTKEVPADQIPAVTNANARKGTPGSPRKRNEEQHWQFRTPEPSQAPDQQY